MRINGKHGMLQSFIQQYTIIMFTVTMVIAVNKPTFKCPDPAQWKFRAKRICNDTEKYICLFDENGQRDEEFCGSWPDFENPGYKQILLGGTTRKPCSEYRYQPFTFWTNGSSKCVYKKTSCTQEGQVIYNNGTAQSDRTCRCDYTNNYDFQVKPRNNCFCVPTVEDCSCYVKPCPAGSRLTPDYECLDESKWKLSFFSCPEIKKDSIDDKDEMSTIISTYGYETPSDSVALPSVLATVLCIAAVCVLVSNLQEQVIIKWRKQNENLEVTHASTQVLNTVKTHGFVILSGPPGSGKSAIAYNTAFWLEKEEAFKLLPVLYPEEIRKYLLPETKQVFVIDDPVGKYTVNDSCIQRWKNEETFIKQTFTDRSNTKLILTCRSYIYKSGFSRILNFSPVHYDLLSDNLKMTVGEREKIYHKYDIPMIPDLKEDTIMMYDFFPLLCALYSTQEDKTMYFVNPYKILREEMKNIKEKSDIAFLALALLVVQDNNIDRQLLSLENNTIKELLNNLCNECGFKYFPSTTVLLSALSDLNGTYIKEKDDRFTCNHDKLFQNLSFIIGSGIIHCLLKYGSSTFLSNRLQFASLQQKHDELIILVKPEQEKFYLQRLLSDMRNGYHRSVFTGIQVKYLPFRNKLKECLQDLPANDLKCDDNNSTPLHVVSEQVEDKKTLEITDNGDLTPFDAASSNGDSSTLALLLRYGAKVNRKDKKMNRTALQRACENGNYNTVTFLLTKKADVKNKDTNGLQSLHIACSKGHLEIVKLLLNHDNNMINERDNDGRTPLFTACENNKENIVCMLLEHKANVNQTNVKGESPLYKACHIGDEKIVGLLLDNAAKVNEQSDNGFSPLYIASMNGKLNCVEILLDNKAEINLATKQAWTPFLISCSKGHLEICQLLHIKGANINTGDNSSSTPLHVACREKHERIVRFLVEHNANINAVNTKKETPLYIACVKECFDIVDLLLYYHADVNICEEYGNSPLHAACLKGNKQIVQLLLDKKADIHKRNKAGKTACDVVQQQVQGREADNMVDMLNQYKAK
ncbi:unnamed protein product [Mytilus coruscus]|uniref:Novel STAND NTPase 3 domain-containing protein n=1 Tax=Mytilus coruscus TaxID=42192 RepID=A0A6J8D6K0_MYTCO|nr:unnamed protein product [Mytilus coruscus]